MIAEDKRIRIIAGHYGSGKTEFAVNYAFALKNFKPRVALEDLDIVNVYFRSREKLEELTAAGIEVIGSSIVQNNCDVPAISARTTAAVQDLSIDCIIDAGGNDVGMRALAHLIPYLEPEAYDFFMVVNTNRPDTSDANGILQHKAALENASGLTVTGFILNTNLIHETTSGNIIEGNRIILEASRISHTPVRYTSYIAKEVELKQEDVAGELFPMKYYMRKDWY